ncbi:MAG: GNAT family N-acetyltransferase [Actinomycetota bacterium]|nr:GNAT family N-acetyltransferase [Actinomycetota bacterium]
MSFGPFAIGGSPGSAGEGGAVRRASASDVEWISAMLARAFARDPVASYIFPTPAVRSARLERFFELQLRHNYLARGEVYVLDTRVAAAMWMPPKAPEPRARDVLAHLALLPLLGFRFLATRELSLMLAARHPPVPHYYLGTIGTAPEEQGRGAGSRLLVPVLARCDATGMPAYLECSKEQNVRFYSRHGFEVREQVRAPGGGPPLWLMWREPLRPG